jgi:hypothetical protein
MITYNSGLDLLRLLLLTGAPLVLKQEPGLISALVKLMNGPDAAVMLMLRCVCNLFGSPEGRNHLLAHRQHVMASINGVWEQKTANKNLMQAYATVLLNYSIALLWIQPDEEFAMDVLAALLSVRHLLLSFLIDISI